MKQEKVIEAGKLSGYVKLAKDQNLPEIPETPVYSDKPYTVIEKQAFRTGAITYKGIVKKANWRKVE